MEEARLLFDAFTIYYNNGTGALNNDEFEIAKRNILAASETLLKLAKISTGALKAKRIKRAEELFVLANQIEEKSQLRTSKTNAKSDIARLSNQGSNRNDDNSNDKELTSFNPVSKSNIKLDDVAGLEDAKEEIRRIIIEPQKHPELYKKFKKNKGGGILLYGVPGTGKTMVAQAIANEIDAKFFAIKCSDIVSKWFGDSEQNVKNLFAEARNHPTSIIFFDEFEALGAKRDSHSTVMKRLVPELLAQIQGFEKSENTLLIIAATNRPWDIDSAFLRPGRFNNSIYVPLPNEKARKSIITKQLDGVPVEENFNTNYIAEVTNGFNGSDVVEFCEKLKDLAIDRNIQSGFESPIMNKDIDETAKKVQSSVRFDDLKKIAKYEETFRKT